MRQVAIFLHHTMSKSANVRHWSPPATCERRMEHAASWDGFYSLQHSAEPTLGMKAVHGGASNLSYRTIKFTPPCSWVSEKYGSHKSLLWPCWQTLKGRPCQRCSCPKGTSILKHEPALDAFPMRWLKASTLWVFPRTAGAWHLQGILTGPLGWSLWVLIKTLCFCF